MDNCPWIKGVDVVLVAFYVNCRIVLVFYGTVLDSGSYPDTIIAICFGFCYCNTCYITNCYFLLVLWMLTCITEYFVCYSFVWMGWFIFFIAKKLHVQLLTHRHHNTIHDPSVIVLSFDQPINWLGSTPSLDLKSNTSQVMRTSPSINTSILYQKINTSIITSFHFWTATYNHFAAWQAHT